MENNQTHKPVDDLDAINTALGWIKEERACALALVTRTWGSAPRPTGSFLAINDQGAFVGSVSGGCIEGEVATEALGLMRNGGFKNLEFAVSDEQATGAGLACGGKVSVHVFAVTPKKTIQLKQLSQLAANKTSVALSIDLATGEATVAIDNADEDIAELLQKGKSGILRESSPCPLFIRPFYHRFACSLLALFTLPRIWL